MTILASALTGLTVTLLVAGATGALPIRQGRRSGRRPSTRLEVALRQAGIAMSSRRFWMVTVAAGAAVFLLLLSLTGVVAVSAAPAVLAGFGPRWWVTRRSAARLQAIQRAWPDAVRDLVASIGAGMSLNRALGHLGETGPIPLRPVFRRYAVSARAVGVVAALQGVRDELSDPTSDRVIEVLMVAHERGGTMVSAILRDLAGATTRDLWVLEEMETESLEQRINARAVFVLPWMVLLAITMQEGPFRDFYRSGAGTIVILVGAVASAVGMAIVSHLGRQPSEPRVFGGRR